MGSDTVSRTRTAPGSTEPRLSVGSRGPGLALAAGAVTMVAGAISYFSAGADLWAARAQDSVASYLADVVGQQGRLDAALSMWCLGALLLGLGGSGLARQGRGTASSMASAAYAIGSGLAITSFLLMMAVVRIADEGAEAALVAEGLGFAGAHLDDVATAVLIGLGPVLVALSGAVSGWLVRWAWACGAAAGVMLVSVYFDASGTWGMVIVPVGIGWSLAAGITALRRGA